MKTKTYDVNGVTFTVKYLGGGDYRVVGPGRWHRRYSSSANAHRDVLCAHLNEAGKARRIDRVTANWSESAMKEGAP